ARPRGDSIAIRIIRGTIGRAPLTARRAAEIEPFEVMDVLSRAHALEAAGRRVVHLEIGEPDFTAPEPVVEAGVRALREGRTAYTATLGLPQLREAIAAHYAHKFAAALDASRVVVTSGASGGLLTVSALYVDAGGGVLVVDEIYQGLSYGLEPWSALGLPGEVVLINSFSKYFCMTGWRLGWVVLPPAAVRGFEKLAQHLFISAPSAAQYAALAAFTPQSLEVLEEHRREFARRRDFLLPQLKSAGLSVPAEPRGAFYVYADCGRDARAYCMQLLEREAVAATPGVDFGANGTARHVRFAYTRAMAELEEAARRIKRFAASSPS